MPYLQLDVPAAYSIDVKRRLARRLASLFADVMKTQQDKVVVAFNELREGNLWRCVGDELHPGAVVKCDIRRGRPSHQRELLAEALVEACAEVLGFNRKRVSILFTQHAGDEIFRGETGLERDWTPAEAISE